MGHQMDMVEFFDYVYDRFDRYWWMDPNRYSIDPVDHPASLITQQVLRLAAGRSPGRVLDLGAGEGADAIRLALVGHEVDAVEISSVGSRKMQRFAEEVGVSLRVHNVDATTFLPQMLYDVIVCNGLLHYVRNKELLLRQIRDATVPGGRNVISLWSTFTPVPECHQLVETYCDSEDGIVTALYKDWHIELLYFDRHKLDISHPDAGPHFHSHIKLIARKPTILDE